MPDFPRYAALIGLAGGGLTWAAKELKWEWPEWVIYTIAVASALLFLAAIFFWIRDCCLFLSRHFRKKREKQDDEKTSDSTDSFAKVETTAFGRLLTITAKPLFSMVGGGQSALMFEWSSGESGVFDRVEGHTFKLYMYDFDGDGFEDLIVRYHGGAHTHFLRIYKISTPPSGPTLVPGGEIVSDFPEISWRQRGDQKGVIIESKSRNWSGSPASDPPLVEHFVFDNEKWTSTASVQ